MKKDTRALASVSALTSDIDEQTTLRHLLDCAEQCRERSLPTFSAFLTPGEQILARGLPLGEGFHLFGGTAEAERKIAAFLRSIWTNPTSPLRWRAPTEPTRTSPSVPYG